MAISRKHMRKIVIEGETYYYKIRHSSGRYESGSDYYLDDYYPEITVVIERPDGKIITHVEDYERYAPFTPKQVSELIRKDRLIGMAPPC